MQNQLNYVAEFNFNKQKIVQNNKEELCRNEFFRIVKTNNPQFLIKFYHHQNPQVNHVLQESAIKAINPLNRAHCKALRIFDTQKHSEMDHLALLTDSYVLGMNDMNSIFGMGYYFDYFKFIVQIGVNLIKSQEVGVKLMHLGPLQVVLDADGNYQLTNFDFCEETIMTKSIKKGLTQIFFNSFHNAGLFHTLAPEVRDGQHFSTSALVWDIGTFLFKILTGVHPTQANDQKGLNISLDQIATSNKANEKLRLLIGNCLIRDQANRLTLKELVIEAINGTHPEIPRLIDTVKNIFLVKMIKSENPQIEKEIDAFSNFLLENHKRDEEQLNLFIPKNNIIRPKNIAINKQLKIIFDPKERVYDSMMKSIVREAWKNPTSIINFYNSLVNGLGLVIKNKLQGMKVLVVLHNYLFYGSQNTLLISFKDSDKRNSLNVFLETLLANLSDKPASMLYRYGYFLFVKVNLNLKMTNFMENNYSVAKTKFIIQYGSIMSPRNLLSLLNFLRFAYSFFISERKYSFDYYYKFFIAAIMNEISSVIGIIANILVYLLFSLMLFEGNNEGLAETDQSFMEDHLIGIVKFLEKVISGMNLYIIQCKILNFKDILVFKKRSDLLKAFLGLKGRMRQILKEPRNGSPKGFTKYFMNALLRMNDSLGIEEFSAKSSIVSFSTEFKKGVSKIIKNHLEVRNQFENLDVNCMMSTVQSSRWTSSNSNNLLSMKSISLMKIKNAHAKSTVNPNNNKTKSRKNIGKKNTFTQTCDTLLSTTSSMDGSLIIIDDEDKQEKRVDLLCNEIKQSKRTRPEEGELHDCR